MSVLCSSGFAISICSSAILIDDETFTYMFGCSWWRSWCSIWILSAHLWANMTYSEKTEPVYSVVYFVLQTDNCTTSSKFGVGEGIANVAENPPMCCEVITVHLWKCCIWYCGWFSITILKFGEISSQKKISLM
jgi:hypothetical protein